MRPTVQILDIFALITSGVKMGVDLKWPNLAPQAIMRTAPETGFYMCLSPAMIFISGIIWMDHGAV